MANLLKNKLFPLLQDPINKYLYGFSKEKLDIALSSGEVTLEKLCLRPDTINEIMDESNAPFWLKAGLIKKIYVGASVMNVLGEIPLELLIDRVDIILGPSYKWILKNSENLKEIIMKETLNPLISDILNKKIDDFDTSIFNVKKVQEIFKDKTVLSQVANSIFNSLYGVFLSLNDFLFALNFSAIIKIKNVHIKFEDDSLMNYNGDISLGMKLKGFKISLGTKGCMKKDSLKLEGLDIYWEDPAKILISSDFLNSCIENGKLQEKYFINLKKVSFEKFEYSENTKFIIQDFKFTMNFGTKSSKQTDIDVFDIKKVAEMFYVQFASNELNINLYPELLKLQRNLLEFLGQFPIIDKVKDYRPFTKPSSGNMNFVSIIGNYKENITINKKLLVRDWLNYVYWFTKTKNSEKVISTNPVRLEFSRFYNICFKNADIHAKKEEEKKEEEKKDEKTEKKDEKIEEKKEEKTEKKDEKIEEKKEEKIIEIPSDLDFSFIGQFLIKGLNISLHNPLNSTNEYISFLINGVEIKIKLTKEKLDFKFGIKTIDLGPSNLINGQRIIIQPRSYRKAKPEQGMTSIKYNVPYGNLSTYKYISLPNSDLGSNISNLIKKYNPRHEEKIKVIDEALEIAESNSRMVSMAASEVGGRFNSPFQNRIQQKTPFGENSVRNLNLSVSNFNSNLNDLSKTYGTVLVPRNTSFAKNLIDNYEFSALQYKKEDKKKCNEINISQAINDYNTYKIREKLSKKSYKNKKLGESLSCSTFKLRNSKFGVTPTKNPGKEIPLNFLEIYSNTEIGALLLNFTKYNNSVTIDNLSIQIGTIRLNMFANYIFDMLKILSEYQKYGNAPQIKKSFGTGGAEGKDLLAMKEYFYNYIKTKIPESQKTDSMREYSDYLLKEINSLKRYSNKPEHFMLNLIFSFFPKGFDFHFDYENIECVAYDKNNTVSSKIIIPSSEIFFNISFTKIFVKALDLEVEVEDLNKCESILEQLKELAKDKFKVAEIILEPCYKELKKTLQNVEKKIDEAKEEIQNNENKKEDIQNNEYNNENTQNNEYKNEDIQNNEYKNEDIQNNEYKNENIQNNENKEDIQNNVYKNKNIQNNVYKNENIQNNEYRKIDIQNNEFKNENIQNNVYKIQEKNYIEPNDGPKNSIPKKYYQPQQQNIEKIPTNSLRNKNIIYQDAALMNKNINTNQNYAIPSNRIAAPRSQIIPNQQINNSIRMVQNQNPNVVYNNLNNYQVGNYMNNYQRPSQGSQYSGYNISNNLSNYSNVNYSVTPGIQQQQYYQVNVNSLENNPYAGYQYGNIVQNVNYI